MFCLFQTFLFHNILFSEFFEICLHEDFASLFSEPTCYWIFFRRYPICTQFFLELVVRFVRNTFRITNIYPMLTLEVIHIQWEVVVGGGGASLDILRFYAPFFFVLALLSPKKFVLDKPFRNH